MKKIIVILAVAISIVSCNNSGKTAAEVKEVKTAYVDTSVLMKEYTEAKDVEAKYKAKAEEKGRQLQAEINRFKQEAGNFQAQAQANGQEWAQKKGDLIAEERTTIGLCTTSTCPTIATRRWY